MKFLFITVIPWAAYKLFVIRNVKNHGAFIFICLLTVAVGGLNLALDYSFADILRKWIG